MDDPKPKKCVSLDVRAVKEIIEEQAMSVLREKTWFLQVINVKIFDTDSAQEGKDQKKQVKLRCTLSDGESTVLAMMNK